MTQFQPGVSGNPVGRPRGSVNKLTKAMQEAAEQVIPLLLQRAMNGDEDAQRLLIERSTPLMRPVTPAEPFTLPGGSVAQQMQALLQQVADGEISVDTATQAMGLVVATAKARKMDAAEAAKAALRNMSPLPVAQAGSTYLAAVQARLGQPSLPYYSNR